jgi:hypothetical protein
MQNINEATQQLASLIDRLRPPTATDASAAERRVRSEAARLAACPDDARRLCDSVAVLLGLPRQGSLYAEAGVRSALGFWLELWQRIGQRILPLVPDDSRLHSILRRIFVRADDHLWVAAVADEAWRALALAIGGDSAYGGDPASVLFNNLRESVRLLSYRLAGAALDVGAEAGEQGAGLRAGAIGQQGVEVLEGRVGPAALEALRGDPAFRAQGGDRRAVLPDGEASARVGLAAPGKDHGGRGLLPGRQQGFELGREPGGVRPLHRQLHHLGAEGPDARGIIEAEPLPHPRIEPENCGTTQEHAQRPGDVVG